MTERGSPYIFQLDAQYQPRVPRSYTKLGKGGMPQNGLGMWISSMVGYMQETRVILYVACALSALSPID